MDARAYFESVRRAALRLEQVQRLIESGGDDWRPTQGSTSRIASDPTGSAALRHMRAVESLHIERETLVAELMEARALVTGIGEGLGIPYRLVLENYYILHLSWEQVSEVCRMPLRTCYLHRDTAFDWVDSVGFAHAKEGTGTAM